MSLEQAITENTAAIKNLTAALEAHVVASLAKSTPAPEATLPSTDKPAERAPKDTKPAKPAAKSAAEVEFKDIEAPFIAYVKKAGRDPAIVLLGELGVKRLSELKPEQYAKALAAIEKASA